MSAPEAEPAEAEPAAEVEAAAEVEPAAEVEAAADVETEEGAAAVATDAPQQGNPWNAPRLPWHGNPRPADILLWAGIVFSGLFYWTLLPLRVSLIGTHPVVAELLNGSTESIISAAAFARDGDGTLAVVLLAAI